MVHRDVKPGNILLDLAGTAYITDFGLVKDSQGSVLTRPGQALGSLDYMPPEQIRGEPVTGAADTYSLGCVVFECVYGRPPFAHHEGMRVLWAHLQDEPPDPSAERTDIAPGFAPALNAALRKEPSERPRPASSMPMRSRRLPASRSWKQVADRAARWEPVTTSSWATAHELRWRPSSLPW